MDADKSAHTTFVLKYESVRENFITETVVAGRFATLKEAVAAQRQVKHECIVHYEPTDLELRDVGDRMAWLDGHGREHPAPHDATRSRLDQSA